MDTLVACSPVSISKDFPHDVLSNIFLLCLEGGDTVEDRRALLDITATCSYWRRVALNRPGLWTRISWRTNNDNAHVPQDNPHNLERFRAYLERSKGALLVVTFSIVEKFDRADGVPRSRESQRVDYDEAWTFFCENHADHCRSLRITVHFQDSFRRFDVLPLEAAKFVRLEEVDIDGLSEEDIDGIAENAALFDSLSLAPLKAIRWRRSCDLCTFFTPDVPTAAIQRLALPFQLPLYSDVEIDRIVEILQQCPRLTHLELEYLDWSTAIEPDQRVTLPNLQSLRISHLWPVELQAMISAPNLTSLSFMPKFIEEIDTHSESDDEEPALPGHRFIGAMEQICGENLRNLELKGNNTPDGFPLWNIRDVALQNPMLTSLRLVEWPLGWSFLWYIHPDARFLSSMTFEKLWLVGEESVEVGGMSRMGVEDEASVETPSATGVVSRTSTAVFSRAPLLPDLECLILDRCSFETLGLRWEDLEALVRAVLRARPQLRIEVYTADVDPAFDPLVEKFGERFRVVEVEAENQWNFFRQVWVPPSESEVWWNSVTDAKSL